jgi:ABC-type branched-subunit amino acid transport system ATPase component
MKLTFVEKYKSIDKLKEVVLPDFTTLVGKNGSGKTQLLEAIALGKIKVDNTHTNNIRYFNLFSFSIANQESVSARRLDDLIDEAWDTINGSNQVFRGTNDLKQFLERLKAQSMDVKTTIMVTALERSGVKTFKELTKEVFVKYADFRPDDYLMLKTLSAICFNYHKECIMSALPLEHGGRGLDKEKVEQMKNDSPWNFINAMFKAYGLPHKIKAPEFNAGELLKFGKTDYEARPVFEGQDISFQDLSSGERILCALAITVYQNEQNATFPELLLLDEIDASLHPSMVKHLLDVINRVFVANGCKVILATHSATTVALVDQKAVYEVKSGRPADRVDKIEQSLAIELLSEGLISLEKGLRIYDQISSKALTIITEGNNVEHLKAAITALEPGLHNKIELLTGIENSSGSGQLKNLFQFFQAVPHSTNVLVVFDCDVNTGARSDGNKTFLYTMPKNTANTLAASGIENMYCEDLFEGFINETINSSGAKKRFFDSSRKNEFAKLVAKKSGDNIFSNYKGFIEKIKGILQPDTSVKA